MEATNQDAIYELNSFDVQGIANRSGALRFFTDMSFSLVECERVEHMVSYYDGLSHIKNESTHSNRFIPNLDESDFIDDAAFVALKAKLLIKLQAEKERVHKIDPEILFNDIKIQEVIQIVSALNPDKAVLQLTTSNSVFFRVFRNNLELHLELFLDVEDGLSAQTMFIIYADDEPIITGSRGLAEAYRIIRDVMGINVYYIDRDASTTGKTNA